ncbi:MAG TPA: hypothetical protein VIY48_07060 [Candidatus Paceibacterota bacterium]
MPAIMQQPSEPDDLARKAGRDIYGTVVGMLRRVELWRLGNAWGMKFPDGASKDYMLPFFKQLEAEGKNPLRPPVNGTLDQIVKAREVEHSDERHSSVVPPEEEEQKVNETAPEPTIEQLLTPDTIQPNPVGEFEKKLLATPYGQLKKICKLRGVLHYRTDKKPTLVARIMAHVQDTPDRS